MIQSHGQFLNIRVSDGVEPLLRRPISIHNIEGTNIEFIFQVKGKGTKVLAQKEVGDKIDILGPLGKGTFKYEGAKNIAIIGGGMEYSHYMSLQKKQEKQQESICI